MKSSISSYQSEVEVSFCSVEILKLIYAESAYNALSSLHDTERPFLLTSANEDLLTIIIGNGFIEVTNKLMAYLCNFEFYNVSNDTLSISLCIPKYLTLNARKRLHQNIERAIAYYVLYNCYSDASLPALADKYQRIYKSSINSVLQSLCPK